MKVYNNKGFFLGVSYLLLSLIGFTLMFLKDFSIKSMVLYTFLFIFSIIQVSRSLSKSKTLEDFTINNDERDQYILLKTSHKTLEILHFINFVIAITLMIAYAITKNKMIIPAFLITNAYITLKFFISLCTTIYYEKHA